MAQPNLSPSDIQLIKKEIEAQGDFLTQERLERITEIDKLRIELEALKRTLDQINPEFSKRFEVTYRELLHDFNPETRELKAS